MEMIMQQMVPKYALGGIGDFLQMLESAKENREILVFTHYKDAKKFFQNFCTSHVTLYSNVDELVKIYPLFENLIPLEKKLYPSFEVPTASKRMANEVISRRKKKNQKVVGIHPIGSDFSNMFWFQKGKPLKYMSEENVADLIDARNLFLLFGTEKELNDNYPNLINKPNVVPICFPNIWDSLAFVDHCDALIGVDSSFKTMSCIRKIPTLVLLGNYEDKYRDENFIDPYVKDGILSVIKFNKIDDVTQEVKAWKSKIL